MDTEELNIITAIAEKFSADIQKFAKEAAALEHDRTLEFLGHVENKNDLLHNRYRAQVLTNAAVMHSFTDIMVAGIVELAKKL